MIFLFSNFFNRLFLKFLFLILWATPGTQANKNTILARNLPESKKRNLEEDSCIPLYQLLDINGKKLINNLYNKALCSYIDIYMLALAG